MLRISGYSANINNNIALFHARIPPVARGATMQSNTATHIKIVIAFEMSIYCPLLSRMGVGHVHRLYVRAGLGIIVGCKQC
jgi:hypothetical protein